MSDKKYIVLYPLDKDSAKGTGYLLSTKGRTIHKGAIVDSNTFNNTALYVEKGFLKEITEQEAKEHIAKQHLQEVDIRKERKKQRQVQRQVQPQVQPQGKNESEEKTEDNDKTAVEEGKSLAEKSTVPPAPTVPTAPTPPTAPTAEDKHKQKKHHQK